MKLTTEQETVCKVFGRRDKHGRVHCKECPMRLDDMFAVCLKVVNKKEAKEEWDWNGDPYPAIHKGER